MGSFDHVAFNPFSLSVSPLMQDRFWRGMLAQWLADQIQALAYDNLDRHGRCFSESPNGSFNRRRFGFVLFRHFALSDERTPFFAR